MPALHTVVETPEFLGRSRNLFSQEERTALVNHLAVNPASGELMQGTGGARKLRWGAKGKGKPRGTSFGTFWDFCWPNTRRDRARMSSAGQSIIRGAQQALDYARGAHDGFVAHVPEEVDVAAIRNRLGLSQADFAARFGFKLDAVQNWEQGRRRPDGAARAFLRVIEREPEAVQRALAK